MAVTSLREKIAVDIVSALENNTIDSTRSLQIKKVTREPVIIEDLAATAMPLVFVESANETREPMAMGGQRMGTIEFVLHLYVKGSTRDSDRNVLLEIIESALTVDTKRNGNALDTQVTDVELITNGESAPYASLAVTVECSYCYFRGSP